MKYGTTSIVMFLLCVSVVLSQPKREFRGAWVATVTNLDWPSSRSLTSSQQQNEIVTLFDQLKSVGINVVIFQIRPECDALYNSPYEPWSYWLTGTQGKAPSPYYDPLQFVVNEAHKRGMELHAWFNPYRAERSPGNYTTSDNHITKTNPSWILSFTSSSPIKMLDPGIPDARNHVAKVISDVVRRYDIDGVHWDDYFYPYAPNIITTQDDSSYARYNPNGLSRADWRRDNVNKLIKMVKDSIVALKPWVKFGISPFGIWKSGVPSGITGTSAYSELYADAVYWMNQLYLDYLTPQLYWQIGGSQDYSKLLPWWNSQVNGRHLYPGMAAYRISSWTAAEMPNQMNINRATLNPQGEVFFRAKNGVIDNLRGFTDSLKNNFYKYLALIPTMPWKDSLPPLSPINLIATIVKPNGVQLQWQKPGKATDNDTARYFVIYRVQALDTVNINNAQAIRFITANDTTRFVDETVQNGMKYTYAITSVDKLHNESVPATISLTVTGVQEFTQIPKQFRLEQNYPNPFNPSTTIRFAIPQTNYVTLKIYDILGREVATVVETMLPTGEHAFEFNASNLASGVYIYRIISGNNVEMKKMILQK